MAGCFQDFLKSSFQHWLKLTTVTLLLSVVCTPAVSAQGVTNNADDSAIVTPAELKNLHPALTAYHQQTQKLESQILEVTRQLATVRQQTQTTEANLTRMEAFEQNAQQILEVGVRGQRYGQLLLSLRARMPDITLIRRDVELGKQALIETSMEELEFKQQELLLKSPDVWLAQRANSQDSLPGTDVPFTDEDRSAFTTLFESRQKVMTSLLQISEQYILELTALGKLKLQNLQSAQALTLKLDERLIWLPSMASINMNWPSQIGQGIVYLVSPTSWMETAKAFASQAIAMSMLSLLVLIIFAALIFQTPRMKKRMVVVAEKVGKVSTDSFLYTLQVLFFTLAMAVTWPLLIGYAGWLLTSNLNHQPFALAVGQAMIVAAMLQFLLGNFALMCRDKGLFEAHFRWSDSARQILGRNLQWLIAVQCTAAGIVVVMQASHDDVFQSGLGRLAFLLGSCGLSLFMYQVFHPKKGMISGVLPDNSWLWRSRAIWFSLLVAIPLILALLAAWGYYETASRIQSRLFTTAWIILVGLIFYSMGMRWVVVAHRRLAVKRAVEAREKAQAAREQSKDALESGEAVPHMLDLPDVNLSSVSDQTRTLLRWLTAVAVGGILWMLWSQLVPALSVLNDITLWNGTLMTEQGPQPMPITLLALLLGLLTLALTYVAARNLPGLLEITAISRLSIDSGTRYAIAAVSRYIIIVTGFLIAFDQIGIQWSKMQWIVAALGVGLGFGLQEIVANFVSGIIILFERPVRVGDTVTVNDLSGTISRIQIRATTIVDWDNREILVPNKNFITNHVVNWTLSDPVTRLVMRVGIAYGSDTAKAHKLMMEVVKANPMVLDTPAPTIFFLGFGDSSLDFDVRIFVSELSKRMIVLHELHMSINRVFAENNIEIPFPQRDLHIRSSDVKWPVIDAGKAAPPAPQNGDNGPGLDLPGQAPADPE